MKWEVSFWNYHKIGLLLAIFIFILLSPPIFPYVQRNTASWFWMALFFSFVVWSFIFILLHTYSGRNKNSLSTELD